MERVQLHLPKLIIQVFSILGCFAGIWLIIPLYSFFGLDIEQCLNSFGSFVGLLFSLITATIFGYYALSYAAAYSMVLLNVVSKEQISQLEIGGKKTN
jgi:hypothetical protein